jgi:hypothetical protein
MGLSLRAAAKELGMSHVGLLKAAQVGRCTAEPDGSYDVEKCRAALAANSNPVRVRAASAESEPSDSAPEGKSLAEASRKLEWEKVRALQQKTDAEAGKLADVARVNAFVAGMIMKARDELTRIGSESADVLARETDPAKCRSIIDDRIFQVLENLKEYQPAA